MNKSWKRKNKWNSVRWGVMGSHSIKDKPLAILAREIMRKNCIASD